MPTNKCTGRLHHYKNSIIYVDSCNNIKKNLKSLNRTPKPTKKTKKTSNKKYKLVLQQ
jgi:hypothetical protein